MCGLLQQLLLKRRAREARALVKDIPVVENTFITTPSKDDENCRGFDNWTSPQTISTLFFRISIGDTLRIGLRLRIMEKSQSTFKYSWNDEDDYHEVTVKDSKGGQYQTVALGYRTWSDAETGYLRLNFQGVRRSHAIFAEVTHLVLSFTNPQNDIVFNNICPEDGTVGRRGPSVKFCYPIPPEVGKNKNMDFFYTEVTIPPGSDIPGLFAVAIGFNGGSIGMQAIGPEERQIVFTIQSDYSADDPIQSPEHYRVELVTDGSGVFNEGISGSQSLLAFNWVAGTTYKFLVHSKMDSVGAEFNSTDFMAWFLTPATGTEREKWELVARFRKPRVRTFLKDFHSSLRNSDPDHGLYERTAYYGNQWARDSSGLWHEYVDADFTGEAATVKGRKDYAGGRIQAVTSDCFYLRHCGFFNEFVTLDQRFSREAEGRVPDIDIDSLPGIIVNISD